MKAHILFCPFQGLFLATLLDEPDLPNCDGQGSTIEESIASLKLTVRARKRLERNRSTGVQQVLSR